MSADVEVRGITGVQMAEGVTPPSLPGGRMVCACGSKRWGTDVKATGWCCPVTRYLLPLALTLTAVGIVGIGVWGVRVCDQIGLCWDEEGDG